MKRSYLIAIMLAVLLAMPLGAAAKTIKLTVAEIHPQDYPTTQGLFKFAELVKQRSKGEIIVDVKYGGQLGKGEKEVVEQVQFGALDMARISVSPVTEFVIQKWLERVEASKKKIIANGNVITELSPEARAGFVNAVQPLYNTYGDRHKAIIDAIRDQQ